jgi:hypothetical protein
MRLQVQREECSKKEKVIDSELVRGDSMRFSIFQIEDGPWIVVDRTDHRRWIASCADAGAARLIAALMNGDIGQATAGREAAIAELDRTA